MERRARNFFTTLWIQEFVWRPQKALNWQKQKLFPLLSLCLSVPRGLNTFPFHRNQDKANQKKIKCANCALWKRDGRRATADTITITTQLASSNRHQTTNYAINVHAVSVTNEVATHGIQFANDECIIIRDSVSNKRVCARIVFACVSFNSTYFFRQEFETNI